MLTKQIFVLSSSGLGIGRVWMLGCMRERHVLQISQSLNKHKLTGLTQKPESLVMNELAPVGNLSVPAASAACEPVC